MLRVGVGYELGVGEVREQRLGFLRLAVPVTDLGDRDRPPRGYGRARRKPFATSSEVSDVPMFVPVASVTSTVTAEGSTVGDFGVLSPKVRSCATT